MKTHIRDGFRTVTPYIAVPEGDRLIAFLTQAFEAEETFRAGTPAGFHAEIRIGDSMLMIGSGEAVRGQERTCAFHVYAPDCDAAYRRAIEAGATALGEPADQVYGERSAFVRDCAGNRWYIATRAGSFLYHEGLGSVSAYVHPSQTKVFIDFLKRAFGAEEMVLYEDAGRVVHAKVRLGNSALEMGDAHDPTDSLPSRFFLYVDDCDLWYRNAVAAGATSIEKPADQSYGHRTAVVLDPFGNEWVPASLLTRA